MLIVDADAHVTEPADLWTSRVPKKFSELVPRVDVHPITGHRHWRIGDGWFWPVAGAGLSQAGWAEYPPSAPWEYEDADPAVYDAKHRLERLDQYGIYAQLLYPNLVGFAQASIRELGHELGIQVVSAYNDFIAEWSSADPKRLIPIAALPYWDNAAAIVEMKRAVENGFKGVLFANKFEQIGLPSFVDPHWDDVYAAAQDLDVPVNYHVGFGMPQNVGSGERQARAVQGIVVSEEQQEQARHVPNTLMTQNAILGTLLTSGLCERFPRLKLVNVETGFGHVPFYLEALDWSWRVHGNAAVLPLLPSEYFKRQCYGTYWFETTTLRNLDLFPNNFMFSTDFPHATGVMPGPCGGTNKLPSEFAAQGSSDLKGPVRDKALYQNANALYKLGLVDPETASA